MLQWEFLHQQIFNLKKNNQIVDTHYIPTIFQIGQKRPNLGVSQVFGDTSTDQLTPTRCRARSSGPTRLFDGWDLSALLAAGVQHLLQQYLRERCVLMGMCPRILVEHLKFEILVVYISYTYMYTMYHIVRQMTTHEQHHAFPGSSIHPADQLCLMVWSSRRRAGAQRLVPAAS